MASCDRKLPREMLERYFQLHPPELRTERLRRRILLEQGNHAKQDAILDLLRGRTGAEGEPTLLDLGSGIGSFLHRARQHGFRAFGVEPSMDQIQCFRQYANAEDVHLVNAVGEQLPFPDASFDLIVSMSVLEHCGDVEAFLAEALRVLKPGGLFYLVFPNYNFIWEPHYDVFWLPQLPRTLNRFYLRLRGRDPGYLDTLNLTRPGRVRRFLESREAHIEDLSSRTYLERINNPGLIGVPSLARLVAMLNRLGLKQALAFLVGLGLYYPVVLLVSRGKPRPDREHIPD